MDDKSKPHQDRYAIDYDGKSYTGYWSLCAAVNRALDNGIPITLPSYYANKASDQDLLDIFKSDTKETCPMLNERIRVMREAGKVLCEVSYYLNYHWLINCYRNLMDLLSIV